jgi:hypothetical protein
MKEKEARGEWQRRRCSQWSQCPSKCSISHQWRGKRSWKEIIAAESWCNAIRMQANRMQACVISCRAQHNQSTIKQARDKILSKRTRGSFDHQHKARSEQPTNAQVGRRGSQDSRWREIARASARAISVQSLAQSIHGSRREQEWH